MLVFHVHIAYMAKCINFLSLSLNSLLTPLLNWFIQIYGDLILLIQSMVFNTISFSLMIILDLPGFTFLKTSQMCLQNFFNSNAWLRFNSLPKSRLLGLMEVVNFFPMPSNLTCLRMALSIKFHVHILLNKMV